MTTTEIVKKLIGNINPAGDSSRDPERLENLKAMCTLISELVYEVEQVAFNNRSAYESSVVKARDFAFNFLSGELEIGYTHDQKGEKIAN